MASIPMWRKRRYFRLIRPVAQILDAQMGASWNSEIVGAIAVAKLRLRVTCWRWANFTFTVTV